MLRMTYSLIVIVAFSTVVSAQQVPPPGFEIVDVTRDPDVLNQPNDLNNCGQAVFSATFERSLANTEIFLYDNGHITRITEDANLDIYPGITENGMIYWLRGVGDAPLTILMEFVDGVEVELAQDGLGISSATMNAAGHYAWVFWTRRGCNSADTGVAFFDGDGTIVIPGEGISRQSIKINERDELVWNEYFFCEDPQRVDVVIYQDGVFTKVNGEEDFAFLPAINDRTQVAYTSQTEGVSETRLWENGVSRTIVDPPQDDPLLNNLGDVTFQRIYPKGGDYGQVWLYRGATEEIAPLTESQFHQAAWAMNDYREVLISSLEFGASRQVRLLRRIRTGDSEFDGDIDIDDLAKLVDCMTGPMWVERVNPGPQESLCECRFLDINHDGSVDLRDYAIFQENFANQP